MHTGSPPPRWGNTSAVIWTARRKGKRSDDSEAARVAAVGGNRRRLEELVTPAGGKPRESRGSDSVAQQRQTPSMSWRQGRAGHGAPAGQRPQGVPRRRGRRALRPRVGVAPPPGPSTPRLPSSPPRAAGLHLLRHRPWHAAFFLAWLSAFEVALLVAGRGTLHPVLHVLTFILAALIPVKLRRAGASKAKQALSRRPPTLPVQRPAAPLRAHLAPYRVPMYCFLDLLLPSIAAAGGALGMETEPQLDRPTSPPRPSLRDFWGRRWNPMVFILRPSVYPTPCVRQHRRGRSGR